MPEEQSPETDQGSAQPEEVSRRRLFLSNEADPMGIESILPRPLEVRDRTIRVVGHRITLFSMLKVTPWTLEDLSLSFPTLARDDIAEIMDWRSTNAVIVDDYLRKKLTREHAQVGKVPSLAELKERLAQR